MPDLRSGSTRFLAFGNQFPYLGKEVFGYFNDSFGGVLKSSLVFRHCFFFRLLLVMGEYLPYSLLIPT